MTTRILTAAVAVQQLPQAVVARDLASLGLPQHIDIASVFSVLHRMLHSRTAPAGGGRVPRTPPWRLSLLWLEAILGSSRILRTVTRRSAVGNGVTVWLRRIGCRFLLQ